MQNRFKRLGLAQRSIAWLDPLVFDALSFTSSWSVPKFESWDWTPFPCEWEEDLLPPDLNGQRMEALSQALGRLYRATTSTSQGWHRGAIGYTRDARGKVHLYPLFDDETDGARVDKLPMPGPPAHPLETPEYLRLRESLIAPCRQIHARSYNRGQDWEDWEIKDDTQLLLHLAFKSDGSPERSRTHSCQVLGTFEPTWNRFTWRTEQPLFTEQVFNLGDFGATYDAAMELALVTAARLGAEWLFVQPIDDRDTVLLVAVFT